jgi:hypothetical protein
MLNEPTSLDIAPNNEVVMNNDSGLALCAGIVDKEISPIGKGVSWQRCMPDL